MKKVKGINTKELDSQDLHFDLVIVGGGLIGASLALALKNQNLKMALIDPIDTGSKREHSEPEQTTDLNARALALSHVTMQILNILQVWPKLLAEVHPILEVHISRQNRWGVTRLRASEHSVPALGYVVNADILNRVLNQGLETISNLTIFRPDKINQLTNVSGNETIPKNKDPRWKLVLNTNRTLYAPLLIAADGTESYLRKQLGIGSKRHAYQQTAMVLNIELTKPHQDTAYERFTAHGSIAMLPFGKNRVKCVWVAPSYEIEALAKLTDSDLLEKIQTHFGFQLGYFQQLGKRIFYPLRSVSAENLYDHGVVLIGNAANTLHPVAAQGFNLGLRDVATLAELLVKARNSKQDIDTIDLLKTYADLRQGDHLKITQLADHLAKPNLLQWLGVLACEIAPPLKRWMTRQGMGLNEEQKLPKLCRGIPLNASHEMGLK